MPTRLRIAAAVAWGTAWGLFALPWSGSFGTPYERGMLWSLASHPPRHLIDAAANFGFYVPLGFLIRSRRFTFLQTLTVGMVLSLGTEVLQLFSSTRVPDLADVVFNTAGVAAGAAYADWRRSHAPRVRDRPHAGG